MSKSANSPLQFCGVASCRKKCDKLTPASSIALAFYGIKKDILTVVKICPECKEKAEQFKEKSVDAVRNFEAIFTLKHEPQNMIPEMVDIDVDDDEEPCTSSSSSSKKTDEDVEVDFDRGDVESLVKNILQKYNLKGQVAKCKQKVEEEVDQLEDEMDDLNEMINEVDNMLYDTCKRYNRTFDKRPKPVVVQEMEINADGSIRQRNIVSDETVFVNSESMKRLAGIVSKPPVPTEDASVGASGQEAAAAGPSETSSVVTDDLASSSDETVIGIPPPSEIKRKPGPASETMYYESMEAKSGKFEKLPEKPETYKYRKASKLLPTPKVIPRIQPKAGDVVYGMYKSLIHFWVKGEVYEVIRNEMTKQTEFIVQFEPTRNGIPTGGVEDDGTERRIRQLSMKEMAVNHPCPFILPVGTRVIAKFKDETNSDPEVDGHYFAAIVAEPPKEMTQMRYLIFFDDGYAQYVHPDDVLLVCESSKQVWNDIYPDSYDFVKDYVTRWPNWPMVKLHLGSIIATEWNGKWLPARILKIDNCLAFTRFENDGREEWIYRGSTRFRPIYKLIEKQHQQQKDNKNNSKENKIPRHDHDQYRNRNMPPVEYKCEEDADGGVSNILKTKGARKSTGRVPYYEELMMFTGNSKEHINMLDPDLCIEYQGSLTKIKVSEDAPKPKDFVPHECSSSCVIEYVPSKELSKKSPLAIPFFFGWNREVITKPRHVVFYRAPCGKRLRDVDELAQFLDLTDCNLSIDQFCFDYDVDCLNQFVPARALVNLPDISYGKEGAPVQCINSIDFETLPFMDYVAERVLAPGVSVPQEEDFLVCCDCTDNCEDKSKCQCWQLTMEGIAFTKLNDETNPIHGYQHRRLKDHVVSGIYECNSRCKCKQTCSNRVVQHGVQWPLQIFKTTKKGWGIRAMYDMPYGTFICIYAGQLMTDQAANEDGMEFGDEYLAELDYIECNEVVKQDYESDVTDIEAEDDDDVDMEDSDDEDEDMEKVLERRRTSKKPATGRIRGDDSDDDGGVDGDEEDSESDRDPGRLKKKTEGPPQQQRRVATRRTMGQKKNLNLQPVPNDDDDMITARATHFNPTITPRRKKRRVTLRSLYGPDEQCFIMDAKSKGNIGRYLNHSCSPNVFVQNVFVDTHDLRFPLVAFFTNSFVKAGTELTWDYHYNIGSVPGKVLYCFCMSPYCRGRLL